MDAKLNLQQVPSLQSVRGVQEVQWVQAGQSYHPYRQNQQLQRVPADSIDANLTIFQCASQSDEVAISVLTYSWSSGSSRTSRSLLST